MISNLESVEEQLNSSLGNTTELTLQREELRQKLKTTYDKEKLDEATVDEFHRAIIKKNIQGALHETDGTEVEVLNEKHRVSFLGYYEMDRCSLQFGFKILTFILLIRDLAV